MAAECNKKQLTLSKFFTSSCVKSPSSTASTDEAGVKLKKTKVAEISFSPPSKRSKGSYGRESCLRQANYEDESISLCQSSSSDDLEYSPKKGCGFKSNSFKNKLDSFRVNSDETTNGKCGGEESCKALPFPLSGIITKKFSVPKGVKLTPLEQQVVSLKTKYPEVILFVECGYKYRFFGEDAEIAAKELNIIAHLDHNFQTASIPTVRLHVHVRRLVAKGYKVGVVKQTETAALKAVSNTKGAPFARELSALYTKATLIGEDVTPMGVEDRDDITETTTSTLMVLMETSSPVSREKQINISIVAVQPSTGEVVFDSFDDSATRTTLWGHLENIQPLEVILAHNVSEVTTKTITAITTRQGDRIRIEQLPEEVFEYSACLKALCQLHEGQEEGIRLFMELPHQVVCCLGATLQYLQQFKLERVLKTGNIARYRSDRQFMKLPGATLRNLEVLANSDDGTEKYSLFWIMNQTKTKFGARLLRQWLLKPLMERHLIHERQEMIQELMTGDSHPIHWLKTSLTKLPDFEKSLTTIFHKKCSPYEFWMTSTGLSQVHRQLSGLCLNNVTDVVQQPSLVRLFTSVIEGLSDIHQFSDCLHEKSAREKNKTGLLKDWSDFEDVVSLKTQITLVESELSKLRHSIEKILGVSSFAFTTVSGVEYLIEVRNSNLKSVPSSWLKINSTKACCRFRSPEVEKHFRNLQQLREELQLACHNAWLQVLDQFSKHYQEYREAVKCLATLDALLSLAKVAQLNGYCRPEIVEPDEEAVFLITRGKHPILSQVGECSEQFVANDTDLKTSGKRVMIVTGPNMGGKSCYMRQVALIALMAQVGSFVPADYVRMTPIDGIYTRMGATDDIFGGKSTFMVEVGETSDIMREVTDKSLVILDELGRGTSTHDGVSIAMSCLDYFLKVKCFTIFVTHYLPLTGFEIQYPDIVGNYHMAFFVSEEDADGIDVVTFLYQLTSGIAGQSYGLNVARLANIPMTVVKRAAEMSKSMESSVCSRRKKKEELRNLISGSKNSLRSIITAIR